MNKRAGICVVDIEAGFAAIEQAALRGERAPTNQTGENPAGTLRSGITTELLKQGRIKVEIYALNWRVIEILTGPHAGERTKGPPNPSWQPYKILPKPVAVALPVQQRKAG